jgi:hypothetical protein
MRAGAEIHQDDYQIARTAHHTITSHLKPCNTIVSRLPLVYKRRRRPPRHGGRHTTARPLAFTILASASINSQGLGGFSSSLASLVAPLRAPWCLTIQHHERTPTGRMAYDRN